MKKRKHDTSMVWLFVGTLAVILALIVLLTLGIRRTSFVKKFVIFTADNFVNAKVYVENEDCTVLLNDQNVHNLSSVSVSGEMYYKTNKLEYSGEEITFTFEKNDTGEKAYIKVSKLSNGKSVVTVTNYEGKEMSAVLNDVKYSSFVRLAAVNSPNGENTVIE